MLLYQIYEQHKKLKKYFEISKKMFIYIKVKTCRKLGEEWNAIVFIQVTGHLLVLQAEHSEVLHIHQVTMNVKVAQNVRFCLQNNIFFPFFVYGYILSFMLIPLFHQTLTITHSNP